MSSKFEKASDVLSTLMKGYGLGPRLDEYKILRIWDKTVGDNISSHTEPKMFIRGVLTVAVDSPSWMQQLTFYKDDLIKKINNGIGRDVIIDIRFKIGKIEDRIKAQGSRLKDITPLQSKKIEGYIEPIKDKEMREIIRRAITKAMIRGKDRG